MPNYFYYIIATIGAYMLGSIPTSVWIGKFFYGIDIREHGSGNAGATNTFRVLGIKAGIPVLAFDVFKGWAAVKFVTIFESYIPGTNPYVNFQIILGSAAVLGHLFPCWANFRGGKGVATMLGLVLAMHPGAALIAACIFITSLLISRYVSLSSLLAGFSFPFVVVMIFKSTSVSLAIFSIVVSSLLFLTHQKNIERLLRRQESKANLFKRKKKRNA